LRICLLGTHSKFRYRIPALNNRVICAARFLHGHFVCRLIDNFDYLFFSILRVKFEFRLSIIIFCVFNSGGSYPTATANSRCPCLCIPRADVCESRIQWGQCPGGPASTPGLPGATTLQFAIVLEANRQQWPHAKQEG